MKTKIRTAALLLALTLLLGFTSCVRDADENLPEGMKLATAAGADFRLYIPTSWNVNTAYGVSGGYATLSAQSTVSVTKHEITAEMEAQMQSDLQEKAQIETQTDGTGEEVDRTGELRIDWFWSNHCFPTLQELSLGGSLAEVDAKTQDLLNKYNAWRYHWKGIVDGTELHFLQVITEKDSAFYLFSFIAEKDQYTSHLFNVELILDNFIFADPYYPDDYVKDLDANAEAPDGMKLASNNDVAYNFYVPESWTVNLDEEIFSAYFEGDRSSVSVVPYMPNTESMSVGEYFALCEEMMKNTTTADGYELLSKTEGVDLGGRVATAYVYRYTVGGTEYRYKQVVAAYKSMIYSLTYTATPEHFDEHLSDVDAMIDVFEFH